jgi:hypothetical protein
MTMTPHINVRAYRPRQVTLAKEKHRKKTRRFVLLSPDQRKQPGLMVVMALVMGLGLTQFFHVRIVELRARIDQLQTSNAVIANENNRIEAASVQLTSKTQIVALAKRKLKLFEPDHGQVRRM